MAFCRLFVVPSCLHPSRMRFHCSKIAHASPAPLPFSFPQPLASSARLDAYLQQLVANGRLSGSVLVSQHGSIFQHAYGFADSEAHIPNITQTNFRLGSVTKQFTAAAILLSQASSHLMFTPYINCPPPGNCFLSIDLGYGYGWFIAKEPQGLLNYHPGGIDGYISYNGFYPDQDVDIIVLSNVESTDVFKIGLDLASLVFKNG